MIRDPEIQIYTNIFVIIEIFHYMIKYMGKKGKQSALELINFSFINIIPFGEIKTELMEILNQLSKYGYNTTIGGRDSSILVSVGKEGIKSLITHDKAFSELDEIQVLDPIKPE